MDCFDDGTLHAYRDGALPAPVHKQWETHLAGCAACRGRLYEAQTQAGKVHTLLASTVEVPDVTAAFHRFHTENISTPRGVTPVTMPNSQRRALYGGTKMNTSPNRWRRGPHKVWTGLVAVIAVLALLALPPVRATADRLLQVFRVKNVVVFPVDPARLEQLADMDIDPSTLFTGQPELVGDAAESRTVASRDEASAAVGFDLQEPSVFPGTLSETEISVRDAEAYRFQVNVASARQVLELLGVTDVTLPDALGATPITANMPSLAMPSYHGSGWELRLYQGRSPEITLPDGVELAPLGEAALRVLGMEAGEASRLSQEIDWTSTLILPIPTDVASVQRVTVGDAEGMLVGAGDDGGRRMLYWQNGERFYVLQSSGAISESELLAAAESVR